MIQDYYITPFTVKRLTQVSDNAGAFSTTESEIANSKGCFYQVNSSLTVINEKTTVDSGHRLSCPVLDIKQEDIITVSSVDYKVKAVNNPMNFNHHLEIELEPKEN